jgi:hypothetical protein
VACVLGVIALIQGLRSAHRLEVSSWPSVQATIIESDVHQFSRASETRVGWRVAADLRLSYAVSGTRHEARYTRVWTPAIVRDFPELLREGRTVDIRYSPEDPTRVSLHPLVDE